MMKQPAWTCKSRVIAVIPNGTTLIRSLFTLYDHLQNCVFSLVANVATRDAEVQTARVESCNLSKLNVNSRGQYVIRSNVRPLMCYFRCSHRE
jgi:hypothetical protein